MDNRKYTVIRTFFPHGIEGESTDNTYSRDFDSFEKAYNHAERYAKGIRFCDYEICYSDTMETIYRKDYSGNIDDFRNNIIK